MGVITVSRQYGAGAQELVEKVSSRMGYRIVDRLEIQKKLIDIADEGTAKRVLAEKAPNIIERLTGDINVLKCLLKESILFFATQGRVILLGRGGFDILRNTKGVLNVLVTDIPDLRASHLSLTEKIKLAEAREKIRKVDREKAGFIKYYCGVDWPDPWHFHLCLTPLSTGIEPCAEAVVKFAEILGVERDYAATGETIIQEKHLLAAATNRIALNIGLDTDLFELSFAEAKTIEIRFFHVPPELREKSMRLLKDFTKDFKVRQAKSSVG